MRFHLYIDCDNAAFEQRLGDEVARILTVVAAMVDGGKLAATSHDIVKLSRDTVRLRDLNGNTVGRYWIETTEKD